jgi:hypothetical protein
MELNVFKKRMAQQAVRLKRQSGGLICPESSWRARSFSFLSVEYYR